MDSTLLGGLIATGSLITGIAISEVLYYYRQNRQKEEDRRDLAGTLAAELRGLVARWRQIQPTLEKNPDAIVWAAEEDYFPIYNSIGLKLLLLPPQLATDVVSRYMQAKAALDSFRVASRLTEHRIHSSRETLGDFAIKRVEASA